MDRSNYINTYYPLYNIIYLKENLFKMNEVIITGIIGVISTIISGGTSWIFARRKYNSEVDNNLIANMQQSLEFYKQLSDDNKSRLEEILKRNEQLEREVSELRTQMFGLMANICLDLQCTHRMKEDEKKR